MSFALWLVCLICMTSGAHGDTGDDFTNNLFTDIAPLLSLFGEQFTKQFMSESMGWMDHLLLAMTPLGILTIITAAIRVGGPAWLRAVIGRARENRATVELELMSSTSHEVCELWNGQGIVRTMGKPEVQEIIFLEEYYDTKTFGLYNLESAKADKILRERDVRDPLTLLWSGSKDVDEETSVIVKRDQPILPKAAPNISLNLHGGNAVWDLFWAVICGISLQLGFLVFTGFTVYDPQFSSLFPKNGKPVLPYAYPMLAAGTFFLNVGIMICSAVVEYSTEEKESVAAHRTSTHVGNNLRGQLLWLQRNHVVSDQVFNASVIFGAVNHGGHGLRRILTSRRRTSSARGVSFLTFFRANMSFSESLTILGMFLGLCGFILQFEGLRGLNWTASIAQLITVALMTAVRAWVRRYLIAAPISQQVTAQHELDWLALWFAKRSDGHGKKGALPVWPKNEKELQDGAEALKEQVTMHFMNLGRQHRTPNILTSGAASEPEAESESNPASERLIWTVITEFGKMRIRNIQVYDTKSKPTNTPGGPQTAVTEFSSRAQRAVKIRQRLAHLTRWSGDTGQAAIVLARAITVTLNTLIQSPQQLEPTRSGCKLEEFSWSLDVQRANSVEQVKLTASKKYGEAWRVDATEIDAVLSLWIYHIHELRALAREVKAEEGEQHTGEAELLDWLQEDAAILRVVRIVGHDRIRLRRHLSWWMGSEVRLISKTREAWTSSTIAEGTEGFTGPIGLLGPPLAETLVADAVSALTVTATGSLQCLLIQHLFAVFMWAVVKDRRVKIDNTETRIINPKVLSQHVDLADQVDSVRLENKVLLELAKAIEETRLCDIQEAYLCLVPPLSSANVLLSACKVAEFLSLSLSQLGFRASRGEHRTIMNQVCAILELERKLEVMPLGRHADLISKAETAWRRLEWLLKPTTTTTDDSDIDEIGR